MVLDTAKDAGGRLDGWHFVIGGSALLRELCEEASAIGAALTSGYGISETGPIGAVGRAGPERYDAIRSGIPVPLVSAQVVDEAMSPKPADDETVGELVLRTPWLPPCYVGDPRASDAWWRDGRLHT